MESVLAAGMVQAAAESALEEGSPAVLPRTLPFVGLFRHAPPSEPSLGKPTCKSLATRDHLGEAPSLAKLPRRSPYVGFHRHAPPSPTLAFKSEAPPTCPVFDLYPEEEDDEARHLPGRLTEEVWALALSNIAELHELCKLTGVSRSMQGLALMPAVAASRQVLVPPQAMAPLARRLGAWAEAWKGAAKVTIPRSAQFLAELRRLAPELPIEVAWRFSEHFKGAGVQVMRHGTAVRRVGDEDVVVLGDAPLVPSADGSVYLEVRLEEFGDDIGDGVNDFGLGVTASEPEKLEEIVPVADECPRSWVADFAKNCVCLSVENCEEAKGRSVSWSTLRQGDRVGLRVAPGGSLFELFINGELREQFVPRASRRIPEGVQLYPLLDLYGHAVQMSRTYDEAPCA